jgi:hypothetical protein
MSDFTVFVFIFVFQMKNRKQFKSFSTVSDRFHPYVQETDKRTALSSCSRGGHGQLLHAVTLRFGYLHGGAASSWRKERWGRGEAD